MENRKIVRFDENKCTGCGQCIPSCHEGAIKIINGKATLIADKLCDGLGDCLGDCPFGAIEIIEREADAYDQAAVEQHLSAQSPYQGCQSHQISAPGLTQWPIQLHLVPITAPYFTNSSLLLSATCVSVACPNYQTNILKSNSVAVACPKLDNTTPYVTKLAAIIKSNQLKSLTVAKMSVPCCNGLVKLAQEAVALAGIPLAIEVITVDTTGQIIE